MARKDISDRQCCEAAQRQRAEKRLTSFILMEMTGQPEKVCERAIERAIGRELLDYGVSVRSSFLTPKGEALLTA